MANLAIARRRSAARARDQRLSAPAAPRRVRRLDGVWPGLVVLFTLLGWEGLARAGAISAFYFPPPTSILVTLGDLVAGGELLKHLAATFSRLVPGLLLGASAGLLVGLAMGWSPRVRALVDPFVAALHPVPKFAILPLIMVIVGVGETSKIIVVALAALFPMLINAMAGVRQISPLHFEVAENYGASRLQVLRRVVLPGSLPMVLSGLRLALNLGFLVTIGSEIMAARQGLGAMIWLGWEVLRVEVIYAGLLVTALLGIGFNAFVQFLMRRLVPWQVERTSP